MKFISVKHSLLLDEWVVISESKVGWMLRADFYRVWTMLISIIDEMRPRLSTLVPHYLAQHKGKQCPGYI